MIKNKLLAALKQLEIETEAIVDNTSLHDELGMDSQEVIELHCCLENIFGSKLPDKFIENNDTFGSLMNKLVIKFSNNLEEIV